MRSVCVAVTLLLASVVGVAEGGSSNSLMDISADGKLLACSNRDSGTVTVLKLPELEVLHEIPVGHKPEGVTFLGRSHRLAVAVYFDDVVRLLDGDTGEVTAAVEVFDEPYGVVSSPDGNIAYVTLTYPGQVIEIDTRSASLRRTIPAGSFLRGCAITADGRRLFVTEYYTGIVKEVDLETGMVAENSWKGSPEDNLCRQIALHPTKPKAYLPHQRSVASVHHGSGSIFPYISVVDTDAPEGRRRVQMDSIRGLYVVANPWEVAITPDGTTLLSVYAGTNDLFACTILADGHIELKYKGLVQVGSNPRAIRIAPDGERFYVYNALDFSVAAYETETLKPIRTTAVCDCPLDDETLLGKKMFYLAKQPMVQLRWISCSGCHPDGESDGRTWQQPEGLRNTQSLAGMGWTHPIHWSADRDEVQDFEHTIRSRLMSGKGLIQGPVRESLKGPNSGLSPELDALAKYANSHDFPLSPHAKNGLSESARRGRALFLDEGVGCTKCHSGPFYTDSRPGPATSFSLHDVGTGNDDPTELIGPKFDTPTLLGIYRTAPYLHHGKAATLRDVLTTQNPQDHHGKTSHLTEAQIDDLVEFLKALPYEDPIPAAQDIGLRRIVK